MKTFASIFVATILLATAVPPAHAEIRVSLDFFADNLAPYGTWREVGDYGYCWQPSDIDTDWRPYSDGRWIYTDAGWTWDSDEPYGWAVYHYGRWTRVARVGWVWVPDTEWGPAWVSWRSSDRHVGWAPLPPEARFVRSIGISVWADSYYDIGPGNYSFVELRNFGAPRLRSVIVQPSENITIINQTTNITNITYVNNVVNNQGPQYEAISRASSQPIRRLKLDRSQQLDGDPGSLRPEQLKTRVEGDSLRVVALPVDPARPASAPKKLAPKVEKVEVDHGWKNAGPPAEVAKLRTKLKQEAKAPADLPPQPRFEKVAAASVVPEPKSGVAEPKSAVTEPKPGAGKPKPAAEALPGELKPGTPPGARTKGESVKPSRPVAQPGPPEHEKGPAKPGKRAKPATVSDPNQPANPAQGGKPGKPGAEALPPKKGKGKPGTEPQGVEATPARPAGTPAAEPPHKAEVPKRKPEAENHGPKPAPTETAKPGEPRPRKGLAGPRPEPDQPEKGKGPSEDEKKD